MSWLKLVNGRYPAPPKNDPEMFRKMVKKLIIMQMITMMFHAKLEYYNLTEGQNSTLSDYQYDQITRALKSEGIEEPTGIGIDYSKEDFDPNFAKDYELTTGIWKVLKDIETKEKE